MEFSNSCRSKSLVAKENLVHIVWSFNHPHSYRSFHIFLESCQTWAIVDSSYNILSLSRSTELIDCPRHRNGNFEDTTNHLKVLHPGSACESDNFWHSSRMHCQLRCSFWKTNDARNHELRQKIDIFGLIWYSREDCQDACIHPKL